MTSLLLVLLTACPTDSDIAALRAKASTADKNYVKAQQEKDPETWAKIMGPALDLRNAARYRAEEMQVRKEECERKAVIDARAAKVEAEEAEARAVEEQRAADTAALLGALKKDPKAVRSALSFNICYAEAEERDALKEIAAEKKASLIGGVANLRILRDAQDKVVAKRALQQAYKKDFKAARVSRLNCSDKAVGEIARCAAEDGCADSDGLVQLAAALERTEYDE